MFDHSEKEYMEGSHLSLFSGCPPEDDGDASTVIMGVPRREDYDYDVEDFRRRRCTDDESSQEEGDDDEKDDASNMTDEKDDHALVDVDNAWDNDSTNWDGEEDHDSCSSAEAREAAIRQGIWGWIVHRIKNDLFQQLLATMAACYEFVVKVLKRCRGGSDSDHANDAADAAQEVVEALDLSTSNHMNSSMTSQTGAGGGGSASGSASASGATAGSASGAGATQVTAAVGQMATQAAASAASASAAVSTVAAASATALTTIASAVASAGVATQVGFTIGVAVVTAAAVSGGMVINSASGNGSNMTAAPVVVDKDPFVPPTCSGLSKLKRGYVELKVQGIPGDALPKHQDKLELLFRDLYNNITGMCLDPYSRVLHKADLVDWSTEDSVVFLDGAANSTVNSSPQTQIIVPVTTTSWIATVACDGCPDLEPLFQLPEETFPESKNITGAGMNNSTNTSSSVGPKRGNSLLPANASQDAPTSILSGRQLQLQANFDMSQFFPLFAASFGFTIEPVLFEDSSDTEASNSRAPMQVVFATTKVSPDRSNGDSTEAIISSIGQDTIQPFVDRVEENEGIIIMPFISDEISSLAKCLSDDDVDEVSKEFALCKELEQMIATEDTDNSALDRQALAACLQAPSYPGCQELLGTALDTVSDSNNVKVNNVEGTGFPTTIFDDSTESVNEEPEAGPNEMADVGMSPVAGPSSLLDEGESTPDAMVPAMPAAPSQAGSIASEYPGTASDAAQQSIPTALTLSGPGHSDMNSNQLPPSPGLALPQASISIARPTMLPSTSGPNNLSPVGFRNQALPPLPAPTSESITQPNAAPSPQKGPVSSNGPPMQSEAKPTPAQSGVPPTAALSPAKLASTALSSDTEIGLLAFSNNGISRPTAQAVQGPAANPTAVASLSPVTSVGLNRFANDHGFLSEPVSSAPAPKRSGPGIHDFPMVAQTTVFPTSLLAGELSIPQPTDGPTLQPTKESTEQIILEPTLRPTGEPSLQLEDTPTPQPTEEPTFQPTMEPTPDPTAVPTLEPTQQTTTQNLVAPATQPSVQPTGSPNFSARILLL
ncbi:domain protein [Seminavis robusta]|uniref:Domain protein n=1 Tax=Seminavis robusta TaxID=568900 RepID=A0A9N8DLC1_9STRA|nr:domain protein [Seminavis robusta]|eukprot:Sro144_g067150.1 domain protein (1060) ;mRNA; r:99084-102524